MEENTEWITVIITISGGAFAIIASIFNWDFFFENRKAQLFLKLFGRNGARIFYSALGLFLLYIGYTLIWK
tara:strand:- start:17608 stop:17820 length:213 start_codon:yes stop_codon:yes gene_type:complete